MNELTFGIPLLSRRVAKDWPTTERLLAATLRSALNQRDASVRVIVACHERPEIDEVRDPRVTVSEVEFDIPRFRWEMEVDRMRKLEALGAALRARGGGWMFTLDADDFVSRDLARTILASQAKAVMVRRGYRLDVQAGRYQKLDKLFGKCGSCTAVRWETDELPLTPLADNPPVYHEFCETRHYMLPQLYAARGWSCKFLEPPLVAYVVNHGTNYSTIITRDSLKWRLYFKLQRWSAWTPALDAEFGVDAGARSGAAYAGPARFSTEFRG